MKKRTIGMLLMLTAIAMLGFQIGATAKYQDSRYIFLMPIAMVLLFGGLFLWFRDINSKKKEAKEQ